MDKQEAVNEFLKGLRVVFNNASAYAKDHPYFLKSLSLFEEKISALLVIVPSVRVNFTADSLFLEEEHLKKNALYEELARIFHPRKIKSIEFRPGVTATELLHFFSRVSLTPRDFFRAGGVSTLIENGSISHIAVEELDYSSLLKEEGEECKDVWVYLFSQTVSTDNLQKAVFLADNFDALLSKMNIREFLQDEELSKNTRNFLAYLKSRHKEKFEKCAKGVVRKVLNDQVSAEGYDFNNIKSLVSSASPQTMADALWDEISLSSSFNAVSFKLFLLLAEQNNEAEIASLLSTKVQDSSALHDIESMRARVKSLFEAKDTVSVPEVYRRALEFIFDPALAARGKKFSFDKPQIVYNYRQIMLNLLTQEEDEERLKVISEKIKAELVSVIEESNFEYLSYIFSVLTSRKEASPALAPVFDDVIRNIAQYVETLVFDKDLPADLEYFIESLQASSMQPQFYIEKIFQENKLNAYVLSLFLKFFPGELEQFYAELSKKHGDMDFLHKIIESLHDVDSPLVPDILHYLFDCSNKLIRIDVMHLMQQLVFFDKEFLFSVLKDDREDILVRKEALAAVIAHDAQATKEAMELLFRGSGFFGPANSVLMENVIIVEELNVLAAREYVRKLSRSLAFWRGAIRKKAAQIARKWDVR